MKLQEESRAENRKGAEAEERDTLDVESQIQSALIKARIESKLTQSELAVKSGIRQSNISRIERGSSVPRIDTLVALAKAMGKKVVVSIQ